MPEVVAILLAAGESRRMGQLKALLPWQGLSLLQYQISTLKAGGIDRVIVVLGHRAEELRRLVENEAGVTCVLNPDYMQGKTTSIKAGLEPLLREKPMTLLMLNVDQPRNSDTIRLLLEVHQAGSALITIPTFKSKGGHPIIIDGGLIDEMQDIDEESQGMKAVVQRHIHQTQRVEIETSEVLWDLNTPEQYQEALGGQ